MIQWDEESKVLTDYMGCPLSRSEALELREQLRKHLKKSPADLAHLAIKNLGARNPRMAEQINFQPEDFE